MKYCKRCLQPDTRPNTIFNDSGLCPACNYYDSYNSINWDERIELLKSIVNKYRASNCEFDCLIGVSGGKDSTRQALWVRDRLKMNPLLVSLSHPPEQVSLLGVDNISNLINLGFNVLLISPAPETWRGLVKEGFYKFSNWARSSELALFSSVPQIAVRYKIPLIFWGENPALQVGDLNTMGRNGYDGNNLRYSNTLSSGHNWMLEAGYRLSDILPYVYPDIQEFTENDIQIIYLGWFLGDWGLVNNGIYSCLEGLNIRDRGPDDTGDLFGLSNLDEDWHNLNQMIKYYKFGFGKVTEYVNEEIRFGKMSRSDGIDLVKKFDGKCADDYILSFCNFINISKSKFWDHINENVNKKLFKVMPGGKIIPKFQVGNGL